MHYAFEGYRDELHIMTVEGQDVEKLYVMDASGYYSEKPEFLHYLNEHDDDILNVLTTLPSPGDYILDDDLEYPLASVHFKTKDAALLFKLTFG